MALSCSDGVIKLLCDPHPTSVCGVRLCSCLVQLDSEERIIGAREQ